jgi:hypothetical protein
MRWGERERVRREREKKRGKTKRCRDKGGESGRDRGESEKERRGGIEPAGQCKQFEYAGWESKRKHGMEGFRGKTGRKRGKKRERESLNVCTCWVSWVRGVSEWMRDLGREGQVIKREKKRGSQGERINV